MENVRHIRRAQAVGRVLWKLGSKHRTVQGGVAAAKTIGKATARATRILWLEVSGFFFAVFALWVMAATWSQYQKIRAADSSAPPFWHVVVGVGFALFLIYFAATSFWRARRMSGAK